MEKKITIEQENEPKGHWIRVHIPYPENYQSIASIHDTHGATLKKVRLCEGSNAIDISAIHDQVVNLKIETPFETILKQIHLGDPNQST